MKLRKDPPPLERSIECLDGSVIAVSVHPPEHIIYIDITPCPQSCGGMLSITEAHTLARHLLDAIAYALDGSLPKAA